jgi:hypothetical protein
VLLSLNDPCLPLPAERVTLDLVQPESHAPSRGLREWVRKLFGGGAP